MPQAPTPPVAIWENCRPPATGTGVGWMAGVALPVPSRPLALYPQQYAALSVVTPHEWLYPSDTFRNVSPPATSTGVAAVVVEPFPNCPLEFQPQQYAAPAVVT